MAAPTLEASLASLDRMLLQRLNVPTKLLVDDYTNIAGGDGAAATVTNCDLSYRFFGASWMAPWGAMLPWILPPSSVSEPSPGVKRVTLRIPQSRVRHFLTDAAVYAKLGSIGSSMPRITRAVLRLGTDRILQSMDSEFACDVALIYKRGVRLVDSASCDHMEKSITFVCPLLLEAPLRTLPLFIPNTPLPEIEYDLSDPDGILSDLQFISEFVSSSGEADLQPRDTDMAGPASKAVVQHMPSFTTFRSDVLQFTEPTQINIIAPTDKLARCLYIRVAKADKPDIANAIASIDVLGPRGQSLVGAAPLPGSVCRTHLKSRFGFATGDKATRLAYKELPYYVLPFASTPCGQTADYGVPLPEGSCVKVVLHPRSELEGVTVEVVVETFTRTVWQRP